MMTPLQQYFSRLRSQKADPLLNGAAVFGNKLEYPPAAQEDEVLGKLDAVIDDSQLTQTLEASVASLKAAEVVPLDGRLDGSLDRSLDSHLDGELEARLKEPLDDSAAGTLILSENDSIRDQPADESINDSINDIDESGDGELEPEYRRGHHRVGTPLMLPATSQAVEPVEMRPERPEKPARLDLTPHLTRPGQPRRSALADLQFEADEIDADPTDATDLEPLSNAEWAAMSEAVKQALRQGDDYLLRDQLTEAIAAYREAVELAPDLAEAHQCLAEALTQQGALEEATVHYGKALELSPLPTEQELRQTVQALVGDEAADPIDNLPWYEQGAFYLQQGKVHCEQGQWEAAIANCEKAIDRLGSHSATAYRLLGRALQEEQRFDEAANAYQKSLVLQSDVAETHARLGSLLTAQEDLPAAVRAYQAAIAVEPKFAGAYLKLGELWQRLGDGSLAVDCWHEALLIEPTWASPEEHLRLGDRLVQQGKLGQAIGRYQQLLELSPGLAEAYYQLASVFSQRGDWYQAMEQYEQAMEQDPSSVQYQAGLGRSLAKLERWQEAIACYQRIVALDPEPQPLQEALQQLEACQRAVVAESYDKMAREFAQQQQWQEAMNCYRMAVDRNPNSAKSQAGLGRSLAGLQQWQEALGCYQAAVRLDAQNFEYGKALAAVLLQLGRFEEAARYYRSLVDPAAGGMPEVRSEERSEDKSEPSSARVTTESSVLPVGAGGGTVAMYSIF